MSRVAAMCDASLTDVGNDAEGPLITVAKAPHVLCVQNKKLRFGIERCQKIGHRSANMRGPLPGSIVMSTTRVGAKDFTGLRGEEIRALRRRCPWSRPPASTIARGPTRRRFRVLRLMMDRCFKLQRAGGGSGSFPGNPRLPNGSQESRRRRSAAAMVDRT